MEVHFSEEQEWLSLCLRVEAVYFLRAGVWERETEFEVLFAAEEMIGKPSTWPPYLTKLWFKKHLDHWGMLKLFNFVLYNGLPLHILYQWLKVRAVQFDGPDAVWVLKSWFDGTHADKGFTYDLIEGCYCYLNGQRRIIPEHLRTKQEN